MDIDVFENCKDIVFALVSLIEYYLDCYNKQGMAKKTMVLRLYEDWIGRALTSSEKNLLGALIDLICDTKAKKLINNACEVFNLSKRIHSACVSIE